jgi:outer membrane protein
MKQYLIAIATLMAFATGAMAQEAEPVESAPAPIYGYLSYSKALQAMPEYTVAMDSVQRFQEACQKEMTRVEKDFNMKYEAFLDGQKEFPRTILLKRQQELQQLLQQNVAFRQQLQEEVKKTQEALLVPVREMLQERLAQIGAEKGLHFILNTDNDQLPWLNPQLLLDVQPLLNGNQ